MPRAFCYFSVDGCRVQKTGGGVDRARWRRSTARECGVRKSESPRPAAAVPPDYPGRDTGVFFRYAGFRIQSSLLSARTSHVLSSKVAFSGVLTKNTEKHSARVWRANVRNTQAEGSASVICHARVVEEGKPFKNVDIHDFVQLTKSRIQGEFLQKLTFCNFPLDGPTLSSTLAWWGEAHTYLTESVCKVVLQKSIPAQICQLILDFY